MKRRILNAKKIPIKSGGEEIQMAALEQAEAMETDDRESSTLKKIDSYEISGIMQKIEGWDKAERDTFPLYGRQRCYRKS